MFLPKQRIRKQFDFCGQSVKFLQPFLLTFKILGIFANDISGNRLKHCSKPFYGICILWVSIYVSYICILTSIYIPFIMNTASAKTHHMPLHITVGFMTQVIGYISLSVSSIAAYSSQNLFDKYFDRLDSYDHEVARMANERRDSSWVPRIAGFLTIIVVLWLICVIISDELDYHSFIAFFSNIFSIIMNIFGTLEIFLLLYLILIRFKHLNEEIVPHVLWNEKHPISIEKRRSKTIKISDVKTLYLILYDAQQAFSNIHSIPLLLCFVTLMMQVLANVRIYHEKNLLETCAYIVPPITQLFILCAIAHYTAEEANKIPCALSESMNALVNSGETMVKIDTLIYFLHNRVSFEAAGYFTINLPLFHSIIATITTYFILLI